MQNELKKHTNIYCRGSCPPPPPTPIPMGRPHPPPPMGSPPPPLWLWWWAWVGWQLIPPPCGCGVLWWSRQLIPPAPPVVVVGVGGLMRSQLSSWCLYVACSGAGPLFWSSEQPSVFKPIVRGGDTDSWDPYHRGGGGGARNPGTPNHI